MKNAFFATTALAVVAFVAADASAAGRWPNWYVGLHGAMNYVGNSDTDGNPVVRSFDSDTGFGYGAAIGYRPATDDPIIKNLRFEGEWLVQQASLDKVKSSVGSFSGDGDTRAYAVMANVFYDFVMHDQMRQPRAFAPYLGFGLGAAKVKLQDTEATLGNTSNSDNVFAWQLMAGINYSPKLIPFTEWSLGYRYFDTLNPEFSYVSGSKFDVDYTTHNLEAGVKFLF